MSDRKHTAPTPSTVAGRRSYLSTDRVPRWTRHALAALALGGAVCMLYRPALDVPFIFDDLASVVYNPSIVKLWPLLDRAGSSPLGFLKNGPTVGRPLVNLSLALNYHFGQLDPRGYHAFNIVLHALSAMLLWAIVGRTLRLDYFRGRFDRVAWPLSLAVAVVWAVHPLDTESVVYITQRSELMMALCYLATLYGAMRYWAAGRPAGRATWLALSSLACVLGMLCKEMMVSAPLVVLLYDRTFISGSFRRAWRESWPLYLGLALAWVPLLALRLLGPRTPLAGFDQGLPAGTYWLTETKVLWIYLKLAFWPWPLTLHYQMPWLDTFAAAWPWLLSMTILVTATLVLLWRRAAAGFVGIWVLAILSPTLLVPMPEEVAAERRMYLPLAAIVALAIIAAYEFTQRAARFFRFDAARPSRRWAAIALPAVSALVLAAVLARATMRRLAMYHDELTLWQDAEIHDPQDDFIQVNLGFSLEKAGRHAEAFEHFQRAVRLKPSSYQAHYNLARALEQSGRPREAILHYEEALRWNANIAPAHNNLGLLLANSGRAEAAIQHYEEALRVDPEFAVAHNNLGIALAAAGRPQEAIAHFERALELKQDLEAYTNLASAYALAGRSVDAVATGQKALELARSQGETALAAQLEAWLATYRKRVPRP